jgi:hypothetical protein
VKTSEKHWKNVIFSPQIAKRPRKCGFSTRQRDARGLKGLFSHNYMLARCLRWTPA